MKNIDIFKTFLGKQRLSVTEERLKIACFVMTFKNRHFSVNDIHFRLCQKGFVMAKSTVYRNLKLLRSAGLIEPVLKNSKDKDTYKNIIPNKVTCKICCLGCGLEEEVNNDKFNDFVLRLCVEYDIEQFGVVVRIEGRKNCPWHKHEENEYDADSKR